RKREMRGEPPPDLHAGLAAWPTTTGGPTDGSRSPMCWFPACCPVCRLALRRLALSAYFVRSRCHDIGEASEPPLSLISQARRMFSRLARVIYNSFHVIAQQLALKCSEVLRRAALQKCINAIKATLHACSTYICPFPKQTLCSFAQ